MADSSTPLAAALTEAAVVINSPRTLEETLDAIVGAAQRSVQDFDCVGISVVHRDGSIETLAGTDQLVWELDHVQYRLDEGPCVEALRKEPVVVLQHPRDEARWPRYLPEATRHGVRSQVGLRLTNDDEVLGGLNFYSTRHDRIDPQALEAAALFATHAAIALGRARQEHQLNEALESRKVIGQAVGILMERYQIDQDRAFGFLVRASSTSHLKLRTVAQELVESRNAQFEGGRDADQGPDGPAGEQT